ncbi:murein biosynthesis integral membrane protein MurJ [Corynebacterium comes]|uniref:Peptidoglycan biosynthesis protein MviN n=1 Tax=Corynebacterium comes TaxID=2675218 RepID=A0A6B8W1J8_9CORY|nr:murein biosynthesis integral membrane protein MurJ [Corynebacterium comes]QGU05867.1 putative peptidoglycan biosynthesis protein MviN [Corynebacterium comes]
MNSTDNLSSGQRARFVAPTPPAPVPEQRAPAPARAPDRSRLTAAPVLLPGDSGVASDSDVVRAGGSMAIATLISRITGFLRNLLIGATLGPAVGSAFNTANTLPNLITEIVLGAVLTSLVVPVLVRAEKEDPDRGEAFFRRLFTLSASLLIVVTLLAVIGAPLLTRMLLNADGQVNIVQSTSFAYLLLPQIFFYGIFALFMAVLNTRGIFKPGAWAPVANNVVSIAVLTLYMTLPGSLLDEAPSGITDPHVLLLGLGTTLGVVVQAVIMLPYLKKAGINLRPLWGMDARLRQFGGMAVAIVVYVAISQVGYAVTTQIASLSDKAAPLIYQQAWLLLQVPYGIIGVTLLTAIMPRLSRNAADGDDRAVIDDLNLGTKLTFIALIPIVVFFTAFGPEIGVALFSYRNFDTESGTLLGLTLSFSAFTLLPYALVLLHLRVFYAREEAWTPTFIIAGITATKIVLSLLAPLVATSPSRVVILLGAANGFGFVAGAVIGALLLRRKLGHLGTRSQIRTTMWAGAASLIGVAVALFVDFTIRAFAPDLLNDLGSFGVLVRVGVDGVIFLIATGIALSFSGLPEVQNLGRAFARIPGISRFIRPDASKEIKVEEPDPQEVSAQFSAMDPFNSSPPPAPMSAGVVRGPRLVPGAPVSDGRFRLLVDHGSVPGARFWHAKELATGREVALTFVDTSGNAPMAPASPAAAAGAAAEVSRRTRNIAGRPGVAENIEVLAYRNGCLVVADWVPGSSLGAVAADGHLDPHAVAAAIAPLADAASGPRPLGLDNRARIRISTDGEAVLAFPAVLPGATAERDQASVTSALKLLASASAGLDDFIAETDMKTLATRLRAFAGVADEEPDTLVVEIDDEPQPDERAGFGAKAYSRKSAALIGVVSIGTVVLVAGLTAYLVSVIGGGRQETPVDSESIQGSATETAPRPLGRVQEIAATSAPELNDGDTATVWSTPSIPAGVVLTLSDPAELQHLVIDVPVGDVAVEVYGVPEGVRKQDPSGLPLLADATLHEGRNSLDLDLQVSGGVLMWFTGQAEVAEVQVVGVN